MEKAGRNDPCSCGSGKKMKKCCGMPPVKKGFKASLLQGVTSSKLSMFFQAKIQQQNEIKEETASLLKQTITVTK